MPSRESLNSSQNIRVTPYENVVITIDIPDEKKQYLPRKWELLGDVLLMKIPPELEEEKATIAKAYAEELGAKTVLRDFGIQGDLREPNVQLLYGSETETTHKENGILFRLDCARLMFSSGNVDERIRMASIPKEGEVVVDMFAGIGFFSLPMAVHSRPKKIYSLELNPVAFQYLQENIKLNNIENIIKPVLGDNRDFECENIADRVVMGYLEDTHRYLPKALDILKDEGGIIHYHEKCPNEILETRPLERVRQAVEKKGYAMELLGLKNIKSYAPGVSHVVLDVRVDSAK
jgi:tRNA wybutosine-synthesizing protein 2